MRIESTRLILNEMRFHAYHGVMEQEGLVGGDYLVSISVEADLSKAVRTDSLADTVNYADLYELVKHEMDIPSKLLEHVAGRIGKCILKRYKEVTETIVIIEKVNPPMGAECNGAVVEVTMTR